MNVNDLNEKWIAAGQEVTDKAQAINKALEDKTKSAEDYKNLQDDYDNAVARRNAAKKALDIEKQAQTAANMTKDDMKPLDDTEKDTKAMFVQDVKNMVTGRQVKNLVKSSEGDTSNAAYTVPEDIQHTIKVLLQSKFSLQTLVNTEATQVPSGSRVVEKRGDFLPLAVIDDEAGLIGDNDDPVLSIIKYEIKRYAGITSMTNTLLKDSAENIVAWLTSWIADKVRVTRNQAIVAQFAKAKNAAVKLAKFDDIKDLQLNTLDPAISAGAVIVTNQAGFTVLAKLKDGLGAYLMQRDVTNPEIYRVGGHQVIAINNRDYPDVSGAHPFVYGDLKAGITLFDRENMSLLATNIGAGAFEHDLNKIRVIDRFDVEVMDDEAFVSGSFAAIADETPSTTPAK